MSVPVESDEPANAVRVSTFINTIDRNRNEIEVLQKSGINYATESIVQTVTNGDTTHAPSGDAVNDFVTAADAALLASTVTNGDTTHAPTGDAVYDFLAGIFLFGSASLNFPNIPAGTVQTATLTVTGAVVGDVVALGPPSTLESGLIGFGRVSATDTVTIRLFNGTAAGIDPAAATWKAMVVRV